MYVLDLFCGVGGAAVGISIAAPFATIVGVDIAPQPEYPFESTVEDVRNLSMRFLQRYDFIWASPPCQRYTSCSPKKTRAAAPDLVPYMREVLAQSGVPYCIENTGGAPLRKDLWLCGQMVGLDRLYRHRYFELSFHAVQPYHPGHFKRVGFGPNDIITVAGNGTNSWSDLYTWQEVMEIDWASQRQSIAEAVPPRYSAYIMGEYLSTLQSVVGGVKPVHQTSNDDAYGWEILPECTPKETA